MTADASTNTKSWQRFALALAVVLLLVVAARWLPNPADNEGQSSVAPSEGAVTVGIQTDANQPPREWKIGYRADMTVADALGAVPEIETDISGRGEDTFVNSIEGLRCGTDNLWWLFEVNGERSKLGAGSHKLRSGDRVLWQFTVYD